MVRKRVCLSTIYRGRENVVNKGLQDRRGERALDRGVQVLLSVWLGFTEVRNTFLCVNLLRCGDLSFQQPVVP